MNEDTTYSHENENPVELTTSSSCSDKKVSPYAPVFNTTSTLVCQTELAMDIPVNTNLSEKYSPEKRKENAFETQENSEEIKQRKEEENLEFYDFCNTKTQNPQHCSDLQTMQHVSAADRLGDLANAGNLVSCINAVSREQEDKNIPSSGQVPILPFNRINTVVSSYQDHSVAFEGLSWQDSVTKEDGFYQGAPGEGITAEVNVVSPMSSRACHITDGGKGHTHVFDAPFENLPACHQQLLNSSREMNVTKEVEIYDDIKKEEENREVSLSLAELKTEGPQTTDASSAFNSLNPHGHMVEIDLNEDIVNSGSEKSNSVPRKPQQLHIDLSKYTELLSQHKATVHFLKRSVVKGMVSQGTRLKDVVNERLSITSKSQETPRPNTLVAEADPNPTSPVTPDNLTTAASSFSHGGATPYLPRPGSNNKREQIFLHNTVVAADAASAIENNNVTKATSGPGFTNYGIQQLIPPVPVIHPQFNNFSIPFHRSPENTGSFLHSTVTQSPGPIRGYNALNPPLYGFPMPPSMPPPPPVSAMEYFAARYNAREPSAPASVLVMGNSPSTVDRAHFSQMDSQRSPLAKQANYVSSFFRLKSNTMKETLQRKISATLPQTSPTGPENDFFMEEGQIQRSSTHSGSHQFRRRGFEVLTADDLLIGALCCCCWPLGLAARLVTLTIPDSHGPVDSCIKAMSNQLSSISLVLGIASYFVFFVLWLSMFIVTVK